MRTRLTSRLSLLFMSFALMLALPAIAFADQLANNIDDSIDGEYEAMALETGGKAKEAKIYIVATDDQQNNCNLNDRGEQITVRVTSSATSVATAKWTDNGTRLIDFSGCGRDDGKMLKVTSGDAASEEDQKDSILPAEITFDITYDNTDKGNFTVNRAQFKVFTTKPSNTAPTVSVTGVQAGASYEVGSVPTAGCSVADAEDANESAAPVVGAVTGPLSAYGIGSQTVTCSYTDGGGLTEIAKATYTINDTGAPSSSHQLSAAANANGWHNADVTVSLTGSDNGSGLNGIHYSTDGGAAYAAYDAANKPVISTEGTTTFSYYAVDNAGNQGAEQSFTVKLDKTAPTIAGSASPLPNAAGWNNTNVTVSFDCDDALSGVPAGNCPADVLLENDGADQSVTRSVTDAAGNTTSDSVSNVDIDKTAPSAPTATTNPLNPVANSGGFFKDTVTVSYSGSTDTLSGVASYTANETFSTSGTHSYSGKATDAAGNDSLATSGSVKVDATAPALNVTCPTGSVIKGSTASANWLASDDESGLATDASGSVPLNTSTVGTQTATVAAGTAQDKVGHGSAEDSCTYSVVYNFSGFFQPIDNLDANGNYILNKAKAGSTVPVKFSLGGDQGLNIFAAGYPQVSAPFACGASTADQVEEYSTATTSGLKYDPVANQYIYNMKSDAKWAGSCRQLIVKLADGTTHRANFNFFK